MGYLPGLFSCVQSVTHPSINQARRKATLSIETNMLAKTRIDRRTLIMTMDFKIRIKNMLQFYIKKVI